MRPLIAKKKADFIVLFPLSVLQCSQGAADQPTSTAVPLSSTVAPSYLTAVTPHFSTSAPPSSIVASFSSTADVPVQAEVLGSSAAVTGSVAAASAVSLAASDQVQTAAKGPVPVQSEHSERSTIEIAGPAAGQTVKTAAVSSETTATSVQGIVVSSAAAGNSDLTPGDLDGIAAALAEAQRLLIAPVADSKAVTIQNVHTTSGLDPLPVTKEDIRPGIR